MDDAIVQIVAYHSGENSSHATSLAESQNSLQAESIISASLIKSLHLTHIEPLILEVVSQILHCLGQLVINCPIMVYRPPRPGLKFGLVWRCLDSIESLGGAG